MTFGMPGKLLMQALIIVRPEGCGLPRIWGKSNCPGKDVESPEVEWHICLGVALGALGFTLWIMHQRVEQRLCKDLLSKKQFIAIRQGGGWTIINPKTTGKRLGNWSKNTNSKTNYVPRDIWSMAHSNTHIPSEREKGHTALNIQRIMTRPGKTQESNHWRREKKRRHQVQPSQEKQYKLISS